MKKLKKVEKRDNAAARLRVAALLNFPGINREHLQKILDKPLLDTADISTIFQRTIHTIRRWRQRGILSYTTVGGSRFYEWVDVYKTIQSGRKIKGS